MRVKLLATSLLAAGALLLTGACGDPADPCQVNPTRTASDGHWVEADGEELDADPCDSDDLDEHGKVKKPSSKPKPKPTKKKL